ncbi:hypothetical protein SB778_32505, partial [Paraburkholderia sp. SIMBA_050]
MTLLASWRSVSGTLVGRAGRLRGMAIVVAALGAAGGSALAADRFAAGAAQSSQSSLYMRFSRLLKYSPTEAAFLHLRGSRHKVYR